MRQLNVSVMTHLFPSDLTQLSGPWLAEQVDALAEHADVSVLAALRHCTPSDVTRPSGVRVKYRPTVVLPGKCRLALLTAAARYAVVARRVIGALEPRPDVVHAHFGFPDAVVATPIARDLGIPLVVTLHGDDAFFLMHRDDWLGRAIRKALGSAAAVICVSPAMYDAVRPALPSSVCVHMLENGYDDRLFTLEEKPRTGGLLFVGTLTKVKNVDVLLHAYAAEDRSEPLVIAGDGSLRGNLEQLARQLGVESRVSFVGVQTREQTAALMKNARALVIPSSSEGYGMVAAEALACGTPVVASRVGGLPTILAGETGGILVEPDSVESLARAIQDILSTQRDPKQVAAASGAVPWSTRARGIIDLYQMAIEAQHRVIERNSCA